MTETSTPVHSDEITAIYDAVQALIDRCEAVDPNTSDKPWNTLNCLRSAQYDLWGAFGYLALYEEGRGLP